MTVRQPPFSLPLCTADFRRNLDEILTYERQKTGRSVVMHVGEFKEKPKVFQSSHVFSTLQVVRHSSISYVLPLGIVSLFVSVICLPPSPWEISLWRKSDLSAFVFHPETEAFFRMFLKAVFQRMDSHGFIPSWFSNQILKRKTQLLIQWNACF